MTRVLQVSAELFPLLKTGGLADVAGALPAALANVGAEPRLLVPGFPSVREALSQECAVAPVALPWSEGRAALLRGRLPGFDMPVYVLDAPGLFDRPGNPYADAGGIAYADNHRRFALLGLAAARLAEGVDPAWRPEIVHAHDWHAGLACAHVAASRSRRRTEARTVFTVHNLAYQGLFPADHFYDLGLPPAHYAVEGLEFYGQVSFMKAGLHFADAITTVSPSYAREIQTPDQGCGLDGLLRRRASALHGILNGVDYGVWSPAHDDAIAARYDAGDASGKTRCKAALQSECGLAVDPAVPLFGIVSRLTEQKGLPLVLEALDDLIGSGGQLVILGSGDARLEAAFGDAAARHPSQIARRIGMDEGLAHRIYAGSDIILVPSRFEPCGLTQLYGLSYGALPLVHRVGGLGDTIVDTTLEDLAAGTATGFVFNDFTADAYRRALHRAFALWSRQTYWAGVQDVAMRQRFGWDAAAERYMGVYRELIPARGV
ncbi:MULTISPECIES: glycogen synthase GlgA [unclassified Roseateles]|uniref:glycogen synthase GlgA n=1 Tax=unclassified Roseateles TaxID=2626991 RepID=UPI0006F1F44A|nr:MULTISPECIES: glycogen synthase GlgA [unclassified Roseateles]KQW44716.1 glycogen synthase [Pelomonas sp. Root405]KRA70075.1 glycogen synthase [Pelomonas sp. Root662]